VALSSHSRMEKLNHLAFLFSFFFFISYFLLLGLFISF
jgi:hypothetical protein